MKRQLKIAIIIPTFNRCHDLRLLLESIYAQVCNEYILIPIIVIDGSNDGTIEMLKTNFQLVKLVFGDGNWWYTKCMIKGYESAKLIKPDFILTLNDDVFLGPAYFHNLLEASDKLSNEAVLGSACLSNGITPKPIFVGIKKIIWWRYKLVPYDPTVLNGSMQLLKSKDLPGRGILIPYHLTEKIGFFDAKFLQYGSDSEFIYRVQSFGIKVFINLEAKVYTKIENTGKDMIYQLSILDFLKSFFNPYSKTYLLNEVRILYKYGILVLLPITMAIKIIGHIRNYINAK